MAKDLMMPVLDKRYDKLILNDACLKDPLLMALAWKKAHDYIRTANWYADNFELDSSSIDLPNRCAEWVKNIQERLEFKSLELVPAPKSHPWEFVKPEDPPEIPEYKVIWHPQNSPGTGKDSAKEQKNGGSDVLRLRPLAHIGIREQTIMTLVMMCLANEVESKQGDPSTDYENVHEKGVVSYGNRLYCRYQDDKAEHSYGATTTYSKYFTDYRKFLERPYYFARKELQEKSEDEEVYLLELDLSQFFDRINRKLLIEKIEKIAQEQRAVQEHDQDTIRNVLTAFKNWDWSKPAQEIFNNLCSSKDIPNAPLGLPQGLVASGFLANIYMEGFDEYMKVLIGKSINNSGNIRLTDYCRYVDDMRIVLVGPNREKILEKSPTDIQARTHLDIIKDELLDKIKPQLDNLDLKSNNEKTNIEVFRGKSVGISQTLEDIQSNVSGPISHEDAVTHLGQLESLLALTSSTEVDQSEGSGKFNRLAAIEKDIFDVREDTLKRFTANKISRLLNNIRHFTSREVDESNDPMPGEWDYLQERLARRFIACWSRDPALVLLLKKGLELFPSTKVLEPVLDQISYIKNIQHSVYLDIPEEQATKQAAIGDYCLAEIFRHAATIIHRKDMQAIPAHADIFLFFELLQKVAIDTISTEMAANDLKKEAGLAPQHLQENYGFSFLKDQARFLLLVRLDTTLEISSGCWFHDFIFKLAKGFRNIKLPDNTVARDIAAGTLIARQLVDDPKPVIRSAASLLEVQCKAVEILELIAIQDAAIFRSLVLHARPLKYAWLNEIGVPELVKKLYIGVRPSAKTLQNIKSKTSLYKLISRSDNPFANEIMALKLMQVLLEKDKRIIFEKAKRSDVIDLAKTTVKFDKFASLPSFEAFGADLSVELEFNSALTAAAKHLHSEHDDTFILQRIALCLRAVLAGSGDPTGFGQCLSPRTGYRGLKTTTYKRQIGLLTTPESLVGETAQFSGWLTTLLSKLLKWPGIRINDQGYTWPAELTIQNVKKLVEARLAKLKLFYCQQSGMPGLPELISPNWDAGKSNLIVAMVQTKMPQQKDFSEHGLFLDKPEYRIKHRKHLARVANLVTKHIEAQHLEKPSNGEREQDIDVIVLPELAVHQDDTDILIHLSRKTHAIIVAGLGFINDSEVKGPLNCAIWIVPRKHNGNQNEVQRLQGKHHMTAPEKNIKVQPWRPYQLFLELSHPTFSSSPGFTLTAAICFDSTDIALSADLRDKSHALFIPALNRDVNTFDSMVEALHYHMYQHIVLVNTGEYGGSYAMAPYNDRHDRLIAHSSGNDQVTINTFKMNMFDFRRDGVGAGMQSGIKQKTAPAGVKIR